LLADACDENFSLRTRIYRSLGQRPHPASIQCLQEATGDPHPFARAQAIRSLGWIGDPSFVNQLIRIAEKDPVADVRRVACKALQRIAGYWMFYGEWKSILLSPVKLYEILDHLVEVGLATFAYDLARRTSNFTDTEYKPSVKWLKDFEKATENYRFVGDSGNYFHLLEEAKRLEEDFEWPVATSQTTRNIGFRHVHNRLNSSDQKQQMQGLYQASRRGLTELAADIKMLTASFNKDIAWNARRALRRLGLGTLNQRRLHPSSWDEIKLFSQTDRMKKQRST
jgi:hypothetical protein